MKQNNFDFLRFYFAFIVVIGHLIELSKVADFQKFSPYFDTAISVNGFFCISGFLITRSYINSVSLKTYFAKRAARLLPAYLFVVVFCFVILSIISTFSFSEYFTNQLTYKYLASNLVFLNFIEPCLPGVFLTNGVEYPVNGSLWTLKVEVSFYLILPLVILLIKKIKHKYFVLIGIYLLSVIYQQLFTWLAGVYNNYTLRMLSHQLPAFLSYFVCGITLHYYFDFFIRNKFKIFIFGLISIIIEHKLGLQIVTPIALSVIIFTFAYSFKVLNSFAKYGDISYGIYIYHFPIINLAIYFGLFVKFNPYVITLIIISIVLFISTLSWHFIEKPFLNKVHSNRN